MRSSERTTAPVRPSGASEPSIAEASEDVRVPKRRSANSSLPIGVRRCVTSASHSSRSRCSRRCGRRRARHATIHRDTGSATTRKMLAASANDRNTIAIDDELISRFTSQSANEWTEIAQRVARELRAARCEAIETAAGAPEFSRRSRFPLTGKNAQPLKSQENRIERSGRDGGGVHDVGSREFRAHVARSSDKKNAENLQTLKREPGPVTHGRNST